MRVSINGGTPKSSILVGFYIINHPFWGTPICGNHHISPFQFAKDSISLKPTSRHLSQVRLWPMNAHVLGFKP